MDIVDGLGNSNYEGINNNSNNINDKFQLNSDKMNI